MLKYVLLCFIPLMVCIREMRSHGEEIFQAPDVPSFCRSSSPRIVDDSDIGRGKITHSTSRSRESWVVILNNQEDDGILMTISPFDLELSFLVIREVSNAVAENTGKIQFISGKSSEPFTFFIPYSKAFYMEICPDDKQNPDNGPGSFTVTYERSVPDYGDGPLPGEPPEIEKERQAVEVQFKGKSPYEFEDRLFISKFKNVLKCMARQYCDSAKIPFDESKLADDMITIHEIHKCPIEWSCRDICVSIHHSIFVSGDIGSPDQARIWQYQLTRENLAKMWATATNDELKTIGLMIYEPSERAIVIAEWFGIVVVPFIVLVGLFYLLRIAYKYIVGDIQNNSFTISEAAHTETSRKSKLKPNKHQQLPSYLKEENLMKDGGGRGSRMLQTQLTGYSAALLFSRLKIEDTSENIK